ncbi:hypothetical protein AGMMS49983_15590 [Clostridia bacterium]|nr:hypothetical protein AGMMS49983_15590 [Clostridia bacterium]
MNIIKNVDFENLGKVVGLFFVADGTLLFHGCSFEEGEHSPRFINYPESHVGVWEREYQDIYGVDYDYYPRGRLLYDKQTTFLMIYADPCIKEVAMKLAMAYKDGPRRISTDEHYQCHLCGEDYVI